MYTQHKTLPKSPASLKFSFIIVFRYFFSPLPSPRGRRRRTLTMFALNSCSRTHTHTHARYTHVHTLQVLLRTRESLKGNARQNGILTPFTYVLYLYTIYMHVRPSLLPPHPSAPASINKQYSPDSGNIIINEFRTPLPRFRHRYLSLPANLVYTYTHKYLRAIEGCSS